MTTTEIKNHVIWKINQITDNELLADICKLVDDNFTDVDVYRLSDNHKIAINKATDQIKNGDYLTNDQAKKEIDEWLKK